MEEMRVLDGGHGLFHGGGTNEDLFKMSLDYDPYFVGVDAGSCDGGPAFLGSGKSLTTRRALKQSLDVMLRGTRARGIPLIMGSAGMAGGRPQVDLFREIIEEVARERGLHFKLALIYSDVETGWLKKKLGDGKVKPLGPVAPLTEEDVDRSNRIVAMMGVEPFMEALDAGADVVVAGRASDSAIFATLPIMHGIDPGVAWHCGKTIECGKLIAEPDDEVDTQILARLREDHFIVEPTHPKARCTVMRVAAHTLYENTDPYLMPEPGEITDASQANFEQIDPRRVLVRGSRHIPQPYTVKLEGSELVGYRTITIASMTDPYLISNIDDYIARAQEKASKGAVGLGVDPNGFKLFYRVYGGDATMAPWRLPHDTGPVREVCIIGECIAETQEIANTVMNFGHNTLLHQGYPGELCSSGSAAFPYSPQDIEMGPVYRFNVWHVVGLDNPMETFSIDTVSV